MNETLDFLTRIINYVQSAPAAILIILALNGLGLMLKKSALPNQIIPWVVAPMGIALTIFLAPMPVGRNPGLLLAVMGFLFGLIAWLAHSLILWRLEKFLPSGFLPEEGSDSNQPPPTKPNP